MISSDSTHKPVYWPKEKLLTSSTHYDYRFHTVQSSYLGAGDAPAMVKGW